MTIQCSNDNCLNNETYCGNGTCSSTANSVECNCNEGFENEEEQPELPCIPKNYCRDVDCGQGYCQTQLNSFSCVCNEGYFNLWNRTDFECVENTLIVANLGKVADSWNGARDACSNYEDGNYTLPVPDSEEFNDYLSTIVTGVDAIPLGISDEQQEGNWINVYTDQSISWSNWFELQSDITLNFAFLMSSTHMFDLVRGKWAENCANGTVTDPEWIMHVICVKEMK